MAFNTPFKMWKRYEFNGGTSDPCIVSWPAGMKSKGEIRHQYHHAIDLVPTVLDALGVWHDGWKAITTHPTLSGWGHFNDDEWELYHTDVDRSELHNLASEQPDKLREMVNLWYAEAGANDAFPLDDRSPLEIILTPRPQLASPRERYTYFPDTAEVPEAQAVNIRNRSFTIGA